MIEKQKVLNIINELGGTDAKNKYDKGWDDAIDCVYNDISNLPEEGEGLDLTNEELAVISFGLGASLKYLDSEIVKSVMKKINKVKKS